MGSMANFNELIESLAMEIRQSPELWNPHYIDVSSWDMYIPIDSGVAVKIYVVDGDEYYSLQTAIRTIGDCSANEESILEVLQETFAEELPYFEKHNMESIDLTSLTLSLRYEDIHEKTESVFVDTSWGDEPIEVNIPADVENREEYSKKAVERMLQSHPNRVLKSISGCELRNPELSVQEG